jgi:hypothetical protein
VLVSQIGSAFDIKFEQAFWLSLLEEEEGGALFPEIAGWSPGAEEVFMDQSAETVHDETVTFGKGVVEMVAGLYSIYGAAVTEDQFRTEYETQSLIGFGETQ